ncbi:MAG: polysaccharide deacetylase family protein [Longimicrobiaceae bacterium]
MMDLIVCFLLVGIVALAALLLWRRFGGPSRSVPVSVGRGLLCLGLALPLVGLPSWRLSNARSLQLLGEIVPRVETGDSLVALTFDDGPLPDATARVLQLLAAEEARATFFLIGSSIEQHPEAARAIADAGHEIGNHSYSHRMMLGLSQNRIRQEIERTDARIREAGFVGRIHFRSPYGKKFVALPYYLGRTGRKNIFWDVEPESDPEIARDSARIVAHVLEKVRPGSIVLMHVMTRHYEPSRAAVPAIVRGLKARGYRLVTVSELLEQEERVALSR